MRDALLTVIAAGPAVYAVLIVGGLAIMLGLIAWEHWRRRRSKAREDRAQTARGEVEP